MRRPFSLPLSALVLSGCAGGGFPVAGGQPPPFDAFQASQVVQVGMPEDVTIASIGWLPKSSQVVTCGVFTGASSTCEELTFGWFENNQLFVYVEGTDGGPPVVTTWAVYKR